MDVRMNGEVKVPKRILTTLIQSLSAGVVPRSGAPYIAIGRTEEIQSLAENLDRIEEGGAAVRFLIGRYGSGKSFLLQLIRGNALDRGFLTADADLSPERKLCGSNGSGLATYRELMRNLAVKASPDGGALPIVLSRYRSSVQTDLAKQGFDPGTQAFVSEFRRRVYDLLSELESGVGGFEFARILNAYFESMETGDEEKKSACLRWLRGEFSTKTEARSALGFSVGSIIDDDTWYDYLKLWALFSTKIGYHGLILIIDECVNLYKIPNRISRESNYEKLLAIFNDTLQGRAPYLGVFFGGTPQFLEDTRRGLFSYEALRSRLEDSRYAALGYRNLFSPVIRLRRLSDDELLALLVRLTRLYAQYTQSAELLTQGDMELFLQREMSRAGAEEMMTPREMIRNYLSVLSIMHENPQLTIKDILSQSAGVQVSEVAPAESSKPAEAAPHPKVTLSDITF